MNDIAIRVEKISKSYRIGGARHRHDMLINHIADTIRGALGRYRSPRFAAGPPGPRSGAETIWALKEVSVGVKQGEVVGVIGRNGAGKSTLLKILARITEPTMGRAEIYGRVASLLEVGTGFHPELTGRENIYLNAAILGMKKAEIERKFDEIVSFAQVAKFIDTPVKRYSSGMHFRLAFAVAAHLEFDILLVDEVLSVGDAPFQEKCLGTMERSASTGKTVFLVSHSMSSILRLCNRAIFLDKGRIAADGPPHEVVQRYLTEVGPGHNTPVSIPIQDWPNRVTNGQARIIRFEIGRTASQPGTPSVGEAISFSIEAEFYEPQTDPVFGVLIHNELGESIVDIRSSHSGLSLGRVKGTIVIEARVQSLGLYPGKYLLSPWITQSSGDQDCLDWVKFCRRLRVMPRPGTSDFQLQSEWGKYWVPSDWTAL